MQENRTSTDILQVQGRMTLGYGIIPKLPMQDKRLTIEAKAIYSYFCSYAGAGTTAFPSRDKILCDLQISENRYYKHFNLLKQYGYIEVKKNADNTGKFTNNIYTLIEMIEPYRQNKGTAKPYLQNPGMDNPSMENPCVENEGTKSNIFKNNSFESTISENQQSKSMTESTKLSTKEKSENRLLTMTNDNREQQNFSETMKKEHSQTATDQSVQGLQESPSANYKTHNVIEKDYTTYEEYESIVKNNINYDCFVQERQPYIKLIDDIVFNILDVLTTTEEYIKIKQQPKKTEVVKSIFLKLKYDHILYVVERFNNVTYPVTYKGSYLKTLLYSSLEEMQSYYQNEYRKGTL